MSNSWKYWPHVTRALAGAVLVACSATAAEPAPGAAAGELRLAHIFGNNMVLQREREIPVWGWATPGTTVHVRLGEAEATGVAGPEGKWQAKLPPQKAGGPLELKVEAGVTLTCANVLVGDVWLCSGQSNMEMGLGGCLGAEEDIKTADFPQIRWAKIGGPAAAAPVADVNMAGPWGAWVAASPKTAMHFTGVGFYFAREVNKETGIPIGLIDDSWSGTSIGPWWAPEGLAAVPELEPVLKAIRQQQEEYRKALSPALDAREAWLKSIRDALAAAPLPAPAAPPAPAATPVPAPTPAPNADSAKRLATALEAQEAWTKATRQALAGNGVLSAPPGLPGDFAATLTALTAGKELASPPALPPNGPADVSAVHAIYNGRIRPLVPFAIRGVLWYQGENNGMEGDSYFQKMRALIGGWRAVWGEGDFPFYFVQLPAWQKANDNPAGGDGWAGVRAAQARALSIANTGMAVTIDVGDAVEIHPKNKYDVGHRLALWALAHDYGRTDVVYSGPLFRELKIEDGKARLFFDHLGGGLMVGRKDGRAAVTPDADAKLARFAIAGEDKVWYWAEARIDGDTVLAWSDKVPKPVAVRYAYSWNPAGANLYNRAGLPACPFRTDNW